MCVGYQTTCIEAFLKAASGRKAVIKIRLIEFAAIAALEQFIVQIQDLTTFCTYTGLMSLPSLASWSKSSVKWRPAADGGAIPFLISTSSSS